MDYSKWVLQLWSWVMAGSCWFADAEDDEYAGQLWRPFFQFGNVGCIPMDIGFPTKESCEEFIREEILGAGLYDDLCSNCGGIDPASCMTHGS